MNLSRFERVLLRRSENLSATKRRIVLVIVLGVGFLTILTAAFLMTASAALLFWVFVAYVLVTIGERIGFALVVLNYKRLIQKLVAMAYEGEYRGARAAT